MKIELLKTIEGGRMFWLDIMRKLKVEVDGVTKIVEVRYVVNNHDEQLEEPYIDCKAGGISKTLADAILYYLSLKGSMSVADVLRRVGLRIDNFVVGGVDMNQEFYPETSGGNVPAIEFDIVADKFVLGRMWFEKEVEFVYNRQIKVNMIPDYHFDCITGVNTVDTCWDKVHSISLMQTRNVNGVDVEHIIKDESVIVDNRVFQNHAIETFLLGYFFGCNPDDNVFFDEAYHRRIDFAAIKQEFFEKLNIFEI